MTIRKKKPFGTGRRSFRENRLNEEITEPQVRLIDDEGARLVSREEALSLAIAAGVDLVEIAKGQDPPIVKIIDYGKFKFEKAKKDKENKKHQKVIQIKEIKMGPKIDIGDFDRKCQMVETFLGEGDNVKVTMRFRGREMAHTNLGLEKMQKMVENLSGIAMIDKDPKLEGKMMTMVLRPKGKK
ncbi:MAG: translation initiation factor IF-3 [Spirochaetia bacterium]|nr:translation initiation factor IF-3 [Spirochaetia bacterium]